MLTQFIQLIWWNGIKINVGKKFLRFRLPLPNSAISSFFLVIFGRRGRQVIVVILHCSTFWKCVLSLVLASCPTFKGQTHILAYILEYKMEKLQIHRGNNAFSRGLYDFGMYKNALVLLHSKRTYRFKLLLCA